MGFMWNDYDENHNMTTTRWLCTTASQIFFMQLGFLCYEVGFVKPVWTQSVILKNIEDTFVGILTFLAFGFTLSESTKSFHGIIAVPVNPLLIGVTKDYHGQILIAAFFASTCATIISGAVLERMKNKAYICWCCITILVNYSFVSHWVWHKDGWLNQLDFVDGAGSVVVHCTAGMSAFVAIWKLGIRKESLDPSGKLKKRQHAARPIIHAIGAFFLWYGWFAFNVASPIAFSRGIGDAIGTIALATVVSPISSSGSAFIWMNLNLVPLEFESLLNCLLAGLVSITGMCHTVNIHEAIIVGVFASIVYFLVSNFMRNKLIIDDPLQVVTIHLFCGMYSGIMEGVVANDVYGSPGLLHGSAKHFGVQVLGVAVIVIFNFVLSLFLWEIVLIRLIFRNEDVRVSILDIYLGTRLFDHNYNMALEEVLSCSSNAGKKMLLQFHQYIQDRYASEQLDFLIVCKIFSTYIEDHTIEFEKKESARYVLQIMDTYIDSEGTKCINISGSMRSILMRIRNVILDELKNEQQSESGANVTAEQKRSSSLNRYQSELYKFGMDITKENVFDGTFKAIFKIVIPHFTQFLHQYDLDKKHFDVKIPFKLTDEWWVEWDEEVTKDKEKLELIDTVPEDHDGFIMKKVVYNAEQRRGGTPMNKSKDIAIQMTASEALTCSDGFPVLIE